MLNRQINAPDDLSRHGALSCPACSHIHGRCMDAVYPFMHLARVTGEEKYITGAMRVMEWAENNVSQADGSWTVVPNPKTWKGISVFGAIALAETLKYHGDLLPPEVREQWTARLRAVGAFLLKSFTSLNFTNINYGVTALHCYPLLAEVLEDPRYEARAQEMAADLKGNFTDPNALLWGEGKPKLGGGSAKGLPPVDLGYNVEESLNGIVHYALHAKDEELLDLVEQSMNSHLAFMLPDGGWDNSWGTRQAKWSYWGSRTTDGSQPALAMMAHRNPALATAAIRTTELLEKCTADSGLIYGGLHYAEHDLPPCIHHTFAHAKPLAALLDGDPARLAINDETPLPRVVADGVRHFPELDVWLQARGPWRATLSTYDYLYKAGLFSGTGGSLTVVHHAVVGPLFLASMPAYKMVEKFNQQPDPDGEDFALTPRLELYQDGKWYTNLYDLTASATITDEAKTITSAVQLQLLDADQQPPATGSVARQLTYTINPEQLVFAVGAAAAATERLRLVLPLISPVTDTVRRIDERTLEVQKPEGTILLQADVPLKIAETKRERVFNMVPGAQALPVYLPVPATGCRCSITVKV